MWFKVEEGIRGRDIDCKIQPDGVYVAIKGQDKVIVEVIYFFGSYI